MKIAHVPTLVPHDANIAHTLLWFQVLFSQVAVKIFVITIFALGRTTCRCNLVATPSFNDSPSDLAVKLKRDLDGIRRYEGDFKSDGRKK